LKLTSVLLTLAAVEVLGAMFNLVMEAFKAAEQRVTATSTAAG
jgi:hypothetical protein